MSWITPGKKLQGNPLGDPTARHVAVFKADGVKDDVPLPLVLFLPGWGSSARRYMPGST